VPPEDALLMVNPARQYCSRNRGEYSTRPRSAHWTDLRRAFVPSRNERFYDHSFGTSGLSEKSS
jgi:hypothetical protein